MRRVWLLFATACSIEPREPVHCGPLICSPGSVCRADGTCGLAPTGPQILQIDNRPGRQDIEDAEILVVLDPSIVDYAKITDPSRDLSFRFVADEREVPFEVEDWNPGGESLVWVRVPRIARGTVEDALIVNFGPDVAREANVGVWDGAELVMHGAGDLSNAARTVFPTTQTNLTFEPGWIGNGITFPVTRDGVATIEDAEVLVSGWNQLTLEMWVFSDFGGPLPTGDEPFVIGKQDGIRLGRYFAPVAGDPSLVLQLDIRVADAVFYLNALTDQALWTYLVWTYDGQILRLYRDGALFGVSAGPMPSAFPAVTGSLTLGHESMAMVGAIDELRIRKRALTAPEVALQFRSQTRQLVHLR